MTCLMLIFLRIRFFSTAVAVDDGLAFSINLHTFLEEKNWKDEKSTFLMYTCVCVRFRIRNAYVECC